MKLHYDVIVAGVGSMGAAACRHLARRGVSVLGLEQFDIPHGRGSHHGQSRMIRQAYSEHPDYVPLLKRAYELWEELQEESGYKLLHLTGGLYLSPRGGAIVKGSLVAARAHDLPHEHLDHAALRKRFPQFRLPALFEGFHEEKAGFVIPEHAVCAHAEGALTAGAELHAREPVLSWEASPAGVEVRTARETYHAGHLVVSAGAWAGRLLRDLGIELKVTRQVLAWFWPRDPAPFALGRFPCWFIETEPGFGHYGFPMVPGQPGVKIALHKAASTIDPDALSENRFQPAEDELEALRQVFAEFIPDAAGRLMAARVCLYTNSPDSHFIIDRHPIHERVTIACGFSGHGFKFASVAGEILADLATEGRTRHPIAFLGLDRF